MQVHSGPRLGQQSHEHNVQIGSVLADPFHRNACEQSDPLFGRLASQVKQMK